MDWGGPERGFGRHPGGDDGGLGQVRVEMEEEDGPGGSLGGGLTRTGGLGCGVGQRRGKLWGVWWSPSELAVLGKVPVSGG